VIVVQNDILILKHFIILRNIDAMRPNVTLAPFHVGFEFFPSAEFVNASDDAKRLSHFSFVRTLKLNGILAVRLNALSVHSILLFLHHGISCHIFSWTLKGRDRSHLLTLRFLEVIVLFLLPISLHWSWCRSTFAGLKDVKTI